jgi:hypothetical protein
MGTAFMPFPLCSALDNVLPLKTVSADAGGLVSVEAPVFEGFFTACKVGKCTVGQGFAPNLCKNSRVSSQLCIVGVKPPSYRKNAAFAAISEYAQYPSGILYKKEEIR